MRIAITGVTGFIGRRLATRALEHGHDVTAFSRRAWAGEPFVPLADRHFLELPDRPRPGDLDGADVVVHLAIAPQAADAATTDAVNRLGTERLFAAAQTASVRRFIFLSSQSAHEGVASAYGESKLAVTRLFADEKSVVIVRPGMVYGNADDGLMGRATRTAAKLRAFPVIGGDAARVQPLHVDELCDALLALGAIDDPPRFVELGAPDTQPLGEFVQAQAHEQFGVTPIAIPVPLGLARAGVRMMTRLHLPSPISETNLDGIEAFAPMDTAADTKLIAQLTTEVRAEARTEVHAVEPRRLILVGAGRIGLVHALTAAHHQQMMLVGIVDLDSAAMKRLASFAGPTIPMFTDLDAAIAALRPDVAIVGTPPGSHVPLARKLLAAGVDLLIEKPLAASEEDRRALSEAVAAHPDRVVGTGYLAGVLPHVAAIAPDLRRGRFGTPVSFDAHAFVSRIVAGAAEQRDMWELDPAVAGGGALLNLGVHVLAMIDLLLGPASATQAELVAEPGRGVEDGAVVTLCAGGVSGTFSTAWHLPGFDMPENHLRIDTDRGYVLCTTSCAAFVSDDEVVVVHQTDADRGFDLAPMDAGGAFWVEQDLLARREVGENSLAVANRVEDLIAGVYKTAARSTPPDVAAAPATRIIAVQQPGVIPDLRGAPAALAHEWTGPALRGSSAPPDASGIIALPDAPGHFRTLTNEGAVTLARELGFTKLGRAAFGISPRGAASASGRPWEALLVMLRAELQRVPRDYDGTLVVDAYLVDLATATRSISVIGNALDDLRRHCSAARIGIEVNAAARLAPQLPAIASRLDLVVSLGTLTPSTIAPLREMLAPATELIVKTGVLPRELLELAWDEPDRWTGGAGSLVVHWPGAPGLRDAHKAALIRAKRAAGLTGGGPAGGGSNG